jgi:hypothetical protein
MTNRAGATLLVAVSVTGVVSQLVANGSRVQTRVRAAHLAEERLEAARALRPDVAQALVGDTVAGRFAPPFDRFAWSTAFRSLNQAYGLIGVEVVITWDQGTFVLSTTLYRRGGDLEGRA